MVGLRAFGRVVRCVSQCGIEGQFLGRRLECLTSVPTDYDSGPSRFSLVGRLSLPGGSFGPDLPWSKGPGKCADDVRGTIRTLSFPDRGLRLELMIATGENASTHRQNQVYGILDTLTVEQPGSGSPP